MSNNYYLWYLGYESTATTQGSGRGTSISIAGQLRNGHHQRIQHAATGLVGRLERFGS